MTESDLESDTSLQFEETKRIGDVFYALTADPWNGSMNRFSMPTLNYGDKASVTVIRPSSFHGDDEWMNAGDPEGVRIRDDIREHGHDGVEDGPEAISAAIIDHYRKSGWDAGEYLVGSQGHQVLVVAAAADGYGTAKALAEELDDWCNGRVYEVQAYKRIQWTDGHGGSFDSWELADCMGGVYLTGDYDSWLRIAQANLDPDDPINPPEPDPDIHRIAQPPIGVDDPGTLNEADYLLRNLQADLSSAFEQIDALQHLDGDEGLAALAGRLHDSFEMLDAAVHDAQSTVLKRIDEIPEASQWDPSNPLRASSAASDGRTR
ncbi:hypothetical protein BSD967_10680 [Bifidobacterium saguini]|uniref:Uncharacterized protein n=1 Tax=Bifidobacterium saguini TaxID=762210 RepID=A0ABX7SBN2_9BIFI|nr:hypothetical protein [Bifidobacterium saguini]QTB90737.1 hypothetical protein BSD967_10680 [Bifidobacterium saguini]